MCKGSHYPPTTPRPVISEVSLTLPLCELESEKTEKEVKLWKLGTDPSEENEAVLSLIAVNLIFVTYYIYRLLVYLSPYLFVLFN